MLELMSWGEIIINLQQEGQLKMVAVFDLTGNKIADSDEALITQEDAAVIMKALCAVTPIVYRVGLMGSTFNCISVDTSTLIGQTNGAIFVAHRNRNWLVCAVADPTSSISCLATVKTFMDKLTH
ncbi:hypothetical protein BsWGS_19860 [Bradybaena similaris]